MQAVTFMSLTLVRAVNTTVAAGKNVRMQGRTSVQAEDMMRETIMNVFYEAHYPFLPPPRILATSAAEVDTGTHADYTTSVTSSITVSTTDVASAPLTTVLVNPPSAYQLVRLSTIYSTTSVVSSINFTSLVFYSSSHCIAMGEYTPDGGTQAMRGE
jgi:hypothetical protein